MTVNAIVAGCNQKSARDPLMETDAERLAPALEKLKVGGLVHCIFPASGRTERWRHIHGCGRFFNAVRDTVSDKFEVTYKAGEPRR